MAKSNDNFILFAALGIGAVVLLPKLMKGGLTSRVDVGPTEIVPPGSEDWARTPDAVIDTEKQKLSIPDAIAMAKDVLSQAKDAFVVVKTKTKHIALRKGRKKLTNTKGRKIRTFKYKGKKLSARKARKTFSAKSTAKFNFGL